MDFLLSLGVIALVHVFIAKPVDAFFDRRWRKKHGLYPYHESNKGNTND